MTADLVIIADDLTGALDTSAPFAAGKSVAVAVTLESLPLALASGADIVAVNTASRALRPDDAAAIATTVARLLRDHAPSHVFKKIDSRLKGNVATECHALAIGLGHAGLVIAPAVPDQGRITRNGAIQGRGVPDPIPLAPAFATTTLAIHLHDAATEADLDAAVTAHDWSQNLAVGARGLGQAFARRLTAASTQPSFAPSRQTLFAFASRDPITAEQIAVLRARYPEITLIEAPNGEVPATAPSLPSVIIATGALSEPGDIVAARFAGGVTALVSRLGPTNLVMGGGDTALAILNRLGVGLVYPQGEAAPGLPWFTIEPGGAPGIACVVKSGGFGTADVLAELLRTDRQDEYRGQR